MNKQQLTLWFQEQQSTLEKIILEAGKAYLKEHEQLPNFAYDLSCSQHEAYNLMNNQDLCYDRYTTPFAYSLWYQARRMNVFVSNFIDKLHEACTSNIPITIFDLGAGTGCIQFCFALAAVAYKRKGFRLPMLRIINVDLSPFMLNYLQKYLWSEVIKHYPEVRGIAVEYHVYSWTNKADLSIVNPWVCASYLFDSSDNEDYLQSNFTELINAFNPSKVLLLTSSQPHKEHLMQNLTGKMKGLGYSIIAKPSSNFVFNGTLKTVSDFRTSLVAKYKLKASSAPVNWYDRSFSTIGLEKFQSGFGFDSRLMPEQFDLFNPPLKIRRQVLLNEDQKKASLFETRPSIITGPAGCGKSVVITEKIINILEERKWVGPLRILVTTFNKSLLKQLRGWISDLLNSRNKQYKNDYYSTTNGVNDGTGSILITGLGEISLEFIHFEMLGKYLGKIDYSYFNENSHKTIFDKFIKETRDELKILDTDFLDILTPDFLLEEYHRVIFGLQCKISFGEDYYQHIKREGRGNKPRLDRGLKRKAVWHTLRKYAEWMHRNPTAGASYIGRRQLFYNLLEKNKFDNKFDYVFVDEFQDCTPADFRIMMMMLTDVNNLIIAGDLAQAVHIGQSGMIPRDGAMSRRINHKLKGSYRLPYRVSEAIMPLSKVISSRSTDKEGTSEITPYKGAPPGARPILVYAKNNQELAEKIVTIKKQYAVFELNLITILEKDYDLCKAIKAQGEAVETTTILKLKGLEKEFIVWSLQADIEYENEVMEFAYTIMTRTNCMLIIGITLERQEYYSNTLCHLRKDRIIYWDSETFNNISSEFENVNSAITQAAVL